MQLTDPNGPRSFQPRHAGSRRILPSVCLPVSIVILLFCTTFGATVSRAQDQQTQSVAEAARQERTRKQELQKHPAHVYTNDDLAHARILTPEDRAQVEVKKMECAQKNDCSPAPLKNSAAGLDANSQPSGTSLGEVARRYRKQKELQALKTKESVPFHLPFSEPALASPVLPERPRIRPATQPDLHAKMLSHVVRRDPFSAAPVPLGPRVPLGSASEIRPVTRPATKLVLPAEPKIASRPVPSPKLFVQPAQPVPVPESAKPALKTQPVHPSIPPTTPTMISPVAPVDVFHSSKPAAARNLFSSVTPVAPVESIRPLPSTPSLAPVTGAAQRTIVVKSGDSLWKLAEQNLGGGSRWPELRAANPSIANPNLIRAGDHLILPATAVTPVLIHAQSGSAASTIKLQKGDTLWSVARSHFGHGASWTCIARANASIADPNLIFAGQLLLVPNSCAP